MARSGGRRDQQPRRAGGSTPDLERLRQELAQVALMEEPTERLLETAAIVAEALADLEVVPVVVGGLAIAYWSESRFRTGDIDVVVPRVPELAERLEQLGFEREGREWVLPGREIAFEAPGEALEPGDRADTVRLPSGRHVQVLSIEDMVLWRLREWIHWHFSGGFHQAAHLLTSDQLNMDRLDTRAREEGLARALSELKRLVKEIENGRTFEAWELAEIGQGIEKESYTSSDE